MTYNTPYEMLTAPFPDIGRPAEPNKTGPFNFEFQFKFPFLILILSFQLEFEVEVLTRS